MHHDYLPCVVGGPQARIRRRGRSGKWMYTHTVRNTTAIIFFVLQSRAGRSRHFIASLVYGQNCTAWVHTVRNNSNYRIFFVLRSKAGHCVKYFASIAHGQIFKAWVLPVVRYRTVPHTRKGSGTFLRCKRQSWAQASILLRQSRPD